jgi:hypothetical protein
LVNFLSRITLRFVEADGVTPVTLSEVPERSSARLTALAVAGIVSFALSKRKIA